MTKVKRIDKLLKARRRLIKFSKKTPFRYDLVICQRELIKESSRIKSKDTLDQHAHTLRLYYSRF